MSEESGSSTAGPPRFPSATALIWVICGDSWNLSMVPGGACTLREESVPEATPGSGLILQWCFGSVPTLESNLCCLSVLSAPLLLCSPSRCFPTWHYQVWDHL